MSVGHGGLSRGFFIVCSVCVVGALPSVPGREGVAGGGRANVCWWLRVDMFILDSIIIRTSMLLILVVLFA